MPQHACNYRNNVIRILSWQLCVVLLSPCQMRAVLGDQTGGGQARYVRPRASPDLSLSHSRLLRSNDAPHAPEQIHLAMAGVTGRVDR